MDDQTRRALNAVTGLDGLGRLEANARRLGLLTDELQNAIEQKGVEIATGDLSTSLGLDLDLLTPAEGEALRVTAAYQLRKKRQGSNANRTIQQIRKRGLLDAVERSVSRSRRTQGYEELTEAGERDLLYEQVVFKHPEEFSERALWFARDALGLGNTTNVPPAETTTRVQQRSELLLEWLKSRRSGNPGSINPYTYENAAAAIGMPDLSRNGQAFGNIQSRLDYACYLCDLPPIGLTAIEPFKDAWATQDRSWAYPVSDMQRAAQARTWTEADFEAIADAIGALPGQAYLAWQKEMRENENGIRRWATQFAVGAEDDSLIPGHDSNEAGSLDSIFRRVCDLQKQYSAQNTPAMQERGVLIRNAIGERLAPYLQDLQSSITAAFSGDLATEGRDGTGRKTLVPWHRIFCKELSPSAQIGWYIVFLFSADGSGVYLSLSHGSTEFRDGSYKPRPAGEIAALVEFARSLLEEDLQQDAIVQEIALNGGELSQAYESSTVASIYYPAEDIPAEEQIVADVGRMVRLLGKIYQAVELGRSPDSVAPDALAVERTLRPTFSAGQGRGLTSKERRVVELRAMAVASEYLRAEGFSITDKSANNSYDLLAKRLDEELFVEVKGTTGGAGAVLMTANEIRLHAEKYPDNALLIVCEIELSDRNSDAPAANGGRLIVHRPWRTASAILEPIAYRVTPVAQTE